MTADEPPFDPNYDQPPNTSNRPPADPQAERALISAVLNDPTAQTQIAHEVTAADFWRLNHEKIWTTIQTLATNNTPADAVLVHAALIQAGHTEAARELPDILTTPSTPNLAPHYAKLIRDHARLRVVDTTATKLHDLVNRSKIGMVEHYLTDALQSIEEAATRWGPTTDTRETGFVDLAWLDGGTPPHIDPPTICRRADGASLFYAGKVNGIFGDPECGKTWLAQAAIIETLLNGGTTAMVDVDHNGPHHTAARLLLLGADLADRQDLLKLLADPNRFRYYQPDDGQQLRAAIDDLTNRAPDVLLIDSIGEAIPMYGANTNDGDEITNAMRHICTRPADAGSCVITIDHLPKSAEARSTGYAIGSIAKKRMIRGAYIRAEARVQPAPGQRGLITLRIEKDTAGELRKTSGGGYAGTFTLDSTRSETHGITAWSIGREEAPKNDDGTFRPTKLMEAISRYVEDNDQCTQRDIESDVPGKSSYLRTALKLLIHEGFISTVPGPRNSRRHHAIALYREAEDDNA